MLETGTAGRLNRQQLKILAVIAMTIDHVGMFFLPGATLPWIICRIIGRLTAPIMCFFLAEGFHHTSNREKYGLRLLLFGLLSQIPYAFSHYGFGNLLVWDFNMVLTLFLSFCVLICYTDIQNPLLRGVSILLLVGISYRFDWGIYAPLWTLFFFVFREDRSKQAIAFSLVAAGRLLLGILFSCIEGAAWYGKLWQAGLFLFLPLLFLYNGQRGKSGWFSKWFFYLYYPLHLLVFGILKYYS